jgi:hypothetical protein
LDPSYRVTMKNAFTRISLVTAGAVLIGGCISGTPVDTSTGNPADLSGETNGSVMYFGKRS